MLRVGGDAPFEIEAGLLVNAAGLHAPALARRIDGLDPRTSRATWFAKGNYYALAGRSPFTHLVYPVPEPGGLGVHLTLDLAGQARFGPDVEWLDARIARRHRLRRRSGAQRALLRRHPPLLAGAEGRRAGARLQRRASEAARPRRSRRATSCCKARRRTASPGLMNLFGIESPGLDGEPGDRRRSRARLGL